MRAVGAVFRSRSGVIFRAGSSKSPLSGPLIRSWIAAPLPPYFHFSADPRQASLTPIGLMRALPVAGLSFARRGRAPTDVTASAGSHRQVISRARPTEFPCSLWNALGRAKSIKTGILRRAIKNPPTDRDDDRRGSRSDVADRYQLFPISNRRRNSFEFWGSTGFSDLWKPSRQIRNTQGEPNSSLQV